MKFKDIKSLDVIRVIENATELFRNKKYQSKKFIEKFIGLNISRAAFYGQVQTADNTVNSLERDQVIFDSAVDITLLIEGILVLKNIPVNNGAGNIVYTGYGLLEVNDVVIYDGRLQNLAAQVIDDGSGTTWNTTSGAVDLGGDLADHVTINGKGKRFRLGNYTGNPANESDECIFFNDRVASGRILNLLVNGSGSNGSISDRSSYFHLQRFGDTSTVNLDTNPNAGLATYLHDIFDSHLESRNEIWETNGSTAKSYYKQIFNEFIWQIISGAGNDKTEVGFKRDVVYINVFPSGGTGTPGVLYIRYNQAQLTDGDSHGIMTIPNGTYVGKAGATHLFLSTGAPDNEFLDGSTNKKGIKLLGFGETNADTAAGANYSTLVNTSLVPKKYVDDSLSGIATNAAAIAANTANIATNVTGINNLASSIVSNDTDIATNATNIASINSTVSSLVTDVTSNDTDIATNATNIAANASAISGITSNVSTNLSEGTTTNTTVDVNSSDGTNATLAAASTTRAGVMTKAKFDEVVANTAKTGITSAQASAITANTAKVTNATHTGEVTGSGALTIADDVVDEANLKVGNTPTDGHALIARSGESGGLKWEAVSGGTTSPLTTKGDVYTYDTGNARLPVGTNGQALVADSTEATGLKWKNLSETPAVGGGLLVKATASTAGQTFNAAEHEVINYEEDYDANGDWSDTTHSFTVSAASGSGTYLFSACAFASAAGTNRWSWLRANVNGTPDGNGYIAATGDGTYHNISVTETTDESWKCPSGSVAINLNVGDVVYITLYHSAGNHTNTSHTEKNTLSISKLSGIKGEKGDTGTGAPVELTKSMFIPDPIATDDIGIWEPGVAITITKIVVQGIGATSTTFNINHSGGTDLFASDKVATTTRQVFTTPDFSDATCTAANYIQYQASAINGTPTGLKMTITYTED